MILKIGKCVNTHGLSGEIRIISNFKYKNRVFIPGFKLMFGNSNVNECINTYRHHKNYEMVTLKGYSKIEEVLKYKGLNVYIDTDDIILEDNEFIYEQVVGYEAYSNSNLIGQIIDIMYNNGNDLFVFSNNKFIPINKNFIEKIDNKNKIIYFKNIEGLI